MNVVIVAQPSECVWSEVRDARVAGNSAWVLTAAVLVLLMTRPPGPVLWRPGAEEERAGRDDAVHLSDGAEDRDLGLVGLFAGVRRRSDGRRDFNPWIGNGDYPADEATCSRIWDEKRGTAVMPMYAARRPIPRLTHMLFQGMFFIITPALICGAFAERMKFARWSCS